MGASGGAQRGVAGLSQAGAVSCTKSADQVLGGSATASVSFDTEDHDTAAIHDTVTNNSRLTVPTGFGGKWHVAAVLNMGSSGSGWAARIKVNGTTRATLPPGAGSPAGSYASVILSLAAADYVELEVTAAAGGATIASGTGANATRFGMCRIAD